LLSVTRKMICCAEAQLRSCAFYFHQSTLIPALFHFLIHRERLQGWDSSRPSSGAGTVASAVNQRVPRVKQRIVSLRKREDR
ncbi:MAG: hypothetical protein Q7T21_12335, partial [Gallionella sp.]|nr:hypothetical protein [Gallionella sp.]